jgi:hypothetical protein
VFQKCEAPTIISAEEYAERRSSITIEDKVRYYNLVGGRKIQFVIICKDCGFTVVKNFKKEDVCSKEKTKNEK